MLSVKTPKAKLLPINPVKVLGWTDAWAGTPCPRVDDQVKHMAKKLNLSDDQQAKLKPILEDQRKQMEQIRDDSSLSRDDRFSKMKSVHENSAAQIKALLNEDQQKKFDKMQEERREHMGGRGPGNGPPPSDGPSQPQ